MPFLALRDVSGGAECQPLSPVKQHKFILKPVTCLFSMDLTPASPYACSSKHCSVFRKLIHGCELDCDMEDKIITLNGTCCCDIAAPSTEPRVLKEILLLKSFLMFHYFKLNFHSFLSPPPGQWISYWPPRITRIGLN